MKTAVVERIQHFNQGRDPKLLQLKYQAMRSDSFVFFRGTCHLFYEDWPTDSPLNQAPPVWICGDLHLENFGSYKGDNRRVYFDINDFDEAALAPCSWDVARFLTSVLVGVHTLGVNEPESLRLCNSFLDAYTTALARGQARSVETETAEGMVKELLESLKERRRKDFLNKHTEEKKGKRRLLIDNKRTRPVTEEQHSAIKASLEDWADKQLKPDFFKLLDVAGRIAGTGSLGVPRYVLLGSVCKPGDPPRPPLKRGENSVKVPPFKGDLGGSEFDRVVCRRALVEGKGSPNQNYLLDLKQERPSSLAPYLKQPQPQWTSEAARVVAIQQRVQGTPPALLGVMRYEGESYVLRELQPLQDNVRLNLWNGKLRRLEKLMKAMGEITAWDQLRSGGQQGSAIADDLIEYATASHWRSALLDYARDYSTEVDKYYEAFHSW